MSANIIYRFSLFLAVFLGVSALAQPGISAISLGTLASGQQSMTVPWDASSISLQQLQALFRQYPAIGQFNIQFPNQTNLSITPDQALALYSNYKQEAQSMGLSGNLPDLTFSSLAAEGIKAGIAQLSVNNGDYKGQIDALVQQARYQSLNLSDWLPDWLKQAILGVYDAVYAALDYVGGLFAALFSMIRQ